jgi:hypothetical protein
MVGKAVDFLTPLTSSVKVFRYLPKARVVLTVSSL